MSDFVYKCDLHCHTNRSDGNDSLFEFIDHAVERGIKILAITDHDIIPSATININNEKIPIVKYANSRNIRLILGIEISCETEIEDVHLICFGCDWNDEFFEELEKNTKISKIKSYHEQVEVLNKNGIQIDWNEILENRGNSICESQVQKKMIFELMADKGYATSWKEAKLMAKNRPEINVKRNKPRAVDIIRKIHDVDGIAILAHPYLISDTVFYEGERICRQNFIEELIASGLDGIEANYTYDKTSYNGSLSKEEICKEVIENYGKRLRIISGGSDYHADGKKGVENPRDMGECGLSESDFYSNQYLSKLI